MQEMIKILLRRKIMLLSVMIGGLALASIVLSVIPPRYTARAILLIEDAGEANSSTLPNAVMELNSRSMLRRLVEDLDLMRDPEFNLRFREHYTVLHDDTNSKNGGAFKSFSVYTQELDNLPVETINADIEKVVTIFASHLEVILSPNSSVIEISFNSYDPQKASLIVNTLADLYITRLEQDKIAANEKLNSWVKTRMFQLRSALQKTEIAVQRYKARYKLINGTNYLVSDEQISLLSTELVQAKSKHAEADARANLGWESGHSLALVKELAAAEKRYGEKHPKMIALRAAFSGERDALDRSAGVEADIAKEQVKVLGKALKELSRQRIKDDNTMVGLQSLQRNLGVVKAMYQQFMDKYSVVDVGAVPDMQSSVARVISYASIPQNPSSPNPERTLGWAAIIALLFGMILVFMLEKMDNSFRSANQIEGALSGVPCFALIPELRRVKSPKAAGYVLSHPASPLAEAVRGLRIVTDLRSSDKNSKDSKVVMMTSSFSGEGKTTLSVWMGRLAAKSGEKVIVIDADLRRPNVHRILGQENELSLVEYLSGQKTLQEVIQKDESSGMSVIYGRSVPNTALDLVGSEKMEILIEELRYEYDLIIIDSPACLAVSDARVLAKYADQTLYVAAWNSTPRVAVCNGVKQFSDIGYTNIATVLTAVDVKRHARYGYGDMVCYGHYESYSS